MGSDDSDYENLCSIKHRSSLLCGGSELGRLLINQSGSSLSC